jgi:hypothetical protein
MEGRVLPPMASAATHKPPARRIQEAKRWALVAGGFSFFTTRGTRQR